MGTPVTLANAYEAVVEYALISDPTITWRNTYSYHSNTTPVEGAGLPAALATFVGGFAWPDTNLVKLTHYNWARGRQPYPSGEPIFVDPVNAACVANTIFTSLATPHHPTGAEVVFRMDHFATSGGRPGRTFIRSLLGMGDVTAVSGGKWTLVPSLASLQAEMSSALAGSGLGAYFDAGSGGQWLSIVRYSPKTNVVHGDVQIAEWSLVGPTTNRSARKNKK